jgi:hypothetical protein
LHEFIHVDDPDQFIHLLYMGGRHYDTHVFTELEMRGFEALLEPIINWSRFVKAVTTNAGNLARRVYNAQNKTWASEDFPTGLHPWTPEGWYKGTKYEHLTVFELSVSCCSAVHQDEEDCHSTYHVSAYNPRHAGRGLWGQIEDRSRMLDAIREVLHPKE